MTYTTTQRMVEAGRIERRHQRVQARRNGLSGMGGPVKPASHAWRTACGRSYRLRDSLPDLGNHRAAIEAALAVIQRGR